MDDSMQRKDLTSLNNNLELRPNSLGFRGQILLLQDMEVQNRKPQHLSLCKIGQTQEKATACDSQWLARAHTDSTHWGGWGSEKPSKPGDDGLWAGWSLSCRLRLGKLRISMHLCFFQLLLWVFNAASISKTYCPLQLVFFICQSERSSFLELGDGWNECLWAPPSQPLIPWEEPVWSRILNQAGPRGFSQWCQHFLCLRCYLFIYFLTNLT